MNRILLEKYNVNLVENQSSHSTSAVHKTEDARKQRQPSQFKEKRA